jgi:transposase
MSIGLPLRKDFNAFKLRRIARNTKDANQARRALALASVYEGASRAQAAAVGGVGRQILRDWVERFNAEGPAGLVDKKAPGQKPKLDAAQKRALVQMIEEGPIPAVHGVVRWRLADLAAWIWEEFRISLAQTTLGRIVRDLGYRKLSARPRHHAQNPEAAGIFKKSSPSAWRKSRAARRRASA